MRTILCLVLPLLFASQALAGERPTKEQIRIFKICQEDVNAHCNNVVPGEGRLIYCLAKNLSTLEHRCAKAINQHLDEISIDDKESD